LQDRLGSGLIEGHYVDGLCPDRQAEDRCQYSNANSKFRHGACRAGLRTLATAFEAPVLAFRRNASQAPDFLMWEATSTMLITLECSATHGS
jgi:hypothetical protein